MGHVARKPVFGVSDKVRFKPVSSATETSCKIDILLVARLDMILSKKRITKALISLRGCAGWSAPVLFANPEDRISHDDAHFCIHLIKQTREFFSLIYVEYLLISHLTLETLRFKMVYNNLIRKFKI